MHSSKILTIQQGESRYISWTLLVGLWKGGGPVIPLSKFQMWCYPVFPVILLSHYPEFPFQGPVSGSRGFSTELTPRDKPFVSSEFWKSVRETLLSQRILTFYFVQISILSQHTYHIYKCSQNCEKNNLKLEQDKVIPEVAIVHCIHYYY